jgi:hypothetical protein
LEVKWEVTEKKPTLEVDLKWLETGISVAASPKRKGYGRELIERALPYQLNAKTKLEFAADAVRCEIVVSVPLEPAHG